MKKVVFVFIAVLLTTLAISCKTDSSEKNPLELNDTEIIAEDLALGNSAEINSLQYMYVTAPSGLSLREFDNLQSEKLARMPYGTKVKIVNAEINPTMTVDGIRGGMHEIEYNHKKGYAFNGYLSKYFPPELNISAKGYASELQQYFPEVSYSNETGGSVTNPSTTETLILPNAEWHEAFYIAQRLFDFPKEFEYPAQKGKKTEVIADKKPKKNVWKSELQISRNDDGLEQILYVYNSEKFDSTVRVEKLDNAMKVSKTEIIK